MEITTVRQHYGSEICVSVDGKNETLKFDSKGVCEVDDSKGVKIVEKYPEFIFSKSEIDNKVEEVKLPVEQENYLRNLQEKVTEQESQINSLKNQVDVAEKDKNEWAKLAEEEKSKRVRFENESTELKKSMDSLKEYYELKVSLFDSNVSALKSICEKSGYQKMNGVN